MFCDDDTISGVSVSGELSKDNVQNVKSPVGVYILLGCCMPFVVLITCWGVIIVCWGVGEVLNAVVGNSFFSGNGFDYSSCCADILAPRQDACSHTQSVG